MSLSVTICHFLSLSVAIFHKTESIVKNFKTVKNVWRALEQTDRHSEKWEINRKKKENDNRISGHYDIANRLPNLNQLQLRRSYKYILSGW